MTLNIKQNLQFAFIQIPAGREANAIAPGGHGCDGAREAVRSGEIVFAAHASGQGNRCADKDEVCVVAMYLVGDSRSNLVLINSSNTTQPVRVDRSNMSKRYLSDFKRRCYEEAAAAEGRGVGGGGECPTMAMTEEQEMNDIQS